MYKLNSMRLCRIDVNAAQDYPTSFDRSLLMNVTDKDVKLSPNYFDFRNDPHGVTRTGYLEASEPFVTTFSPLPPALYASSFPKEAPWDQK